MIFKKKVFRLQKEIDYSINLEEYFIQYLVYVFIRKHVKPIIFDLVDNIENILQIEKKSY